MSRANNALDGYLCLVEEKKKVLEFSARYALDFGITGPSKSADARIMVIKIRVDHMKVYRALDSYHKKLSISLKA